MEPLSEAHRLLRRQCELEAAMRRPGRPESPRSVGHTSSTTASASPPPLSAPSWMRRDVCSGPSTRCRSRTLTPDSRKAQAGRTPKGELPAASSCMEQSKRLFGIDTDVGSLVDREAHVQIATDQNEERCFRP